MSLFTERRRLNTQFATSKKTTALKIASKMMRLGYVPDDLKRLASLIDPDSIKPIQPGMTVREAALRPKAALKTSILATLELKIIGKHFAKHRGRMEPDDDITKGLTPSDYNQYRKRSIKELAGEFGLTEHTIRRHIREAKKRTGNPSS